MNNKTIILILVVILIIAGILYLESTKIKFPTQEINSEIDTQLDTNNLKQGKYQKAPDLVGISGYLNTENITISKFTEQGKVVLIDFWTYSCINCIRTFPYLASWHEKYEDKGLVIIGVHAPEFEFEKDYKNVQDAIDKYDIKYPVVQDNDHATWRAFKNNFWPRKYLIDNEGFIRYDHIGEGGYDETEEKIQELLEESGILSQNIELTELEKRDNRALTPELYTGYNFALPRGQDIGNTPGLKPDETNDYKLPINIDHNKIYLDGEWKSNPDDLQLVSKEGSIVLSFFATSVNIVADSINSPVEVEVFINDKYVSNEQAGSDVQFQDEKALIIVDKPQLYNVFDSGFEGYDNYKLTLKVKSAGLTINSYTFG